VIRTWNSRKMVSVKGWIAPVFAEQLVLLMDPTGVEAGGGCDFLQQCAQRYLGFERKIPGGVQRVSVVTIVNCHLSFAGPATPEACCG